MDKYLLVMDSYGKVDNFQPVLITKSMKYTWKRDERKFAFENHIFRRKNWYGANHQSKLSSNM